MASLTIWHIYLYILVKKNFKHFYWSIKCIKNAPLYPKMQKIKKEKKVKVQLTQLNFRRQIY